MSGEGPEDEPPELTVAEMLELGLDALLDQARRRMARPMADDTSKTGKPDRDRINVNEDYELREWAKKFGVTPERLREAVKTSGPMVKDIEAFLGKHIR